MFLLIVLLLVLKYTEMLSPSDTGYETVHFPGNSTTLQVYLDVYRNAEKLKFISLSRRDYLTDEEDVDISWQAHTEGRGRP